MKTRNSIGKLICGDRETMHEDIRQQARCAASGFAAAGVTTGDTIAIMLRNDFPFVVSTLAAAMLEATATPINWHYTADEACWILSNSHAKVLVIHADIWRNIASDIPQGISENLTVVAVETPRDLASAHRVDDSLCTVPEEVLSWSSWIKSQEEWQGPAPKPQSAMIYTSGTTGRPKGVRRMGPVPVTTRGNHGSFVEEARFLLTAPMYHSAPNRAAMSTFYVGGDIVIAPRFDAENTLALIETHGITHSFMVPTMLIRLLKLPEEVRSRYDVSSLKHVVIAGAHCPPEVKTAIIKWWGPALYEYYGGTETGAITYCTSEEALAHPGTVGHAVPDATIRILDENGNECPTGTHGEIFGRLHPLPDFTYQNDPDARAEIEKHGLITCGDIGYLDEDGYLFLSDRKKDMVISGGVNIYPAEIEAALFACKGVLDCAVFGLPDDELGEIAAAAILPEPGAILDVSDLNDAIGQKIARFMIPRKTFIVEELPRDDSGKIFKRKLRDIYGSGSA
jgi:long-chain acyl-CoA synthetase